MNTDSRYSIGEVAKKLKISPHTLRYYEKEKVILSIARNNQGIREYHESDINWLELVNCLKETGMSLSDIKKFVTLSTQENSQETIPLRKEILINHRRNVIEKLEEMQKHLEKVDGKIAYYSRIELEE